MFQFVEDAVRGIEYPEEGAAVKVCTLLAEDIYKSIPPEVEVANV